MKQDTMMRPRAPHLLLAFTALISSACATAGKISTPAVRVPATSGWSTQAQGAVSGTQDLSRWWEQLRDTTLTSLIDRAIAGSPDLRTAQARLRQARAQRSITAADLTPTVTASASGSDRNNSPAGFSATFDASWEPDIFGGIRKGVEAATADVRASAADLNATRVSLAAEVARNYVELRTFQTRLEVARRNEASQAETLELTQFRSQAGLVGSVDVEQARANLEQTRAQIPTLESNVTQSIHRLSTLAGLQPAALSAQLTAAGTLPEVPGQVAIGIPAETLRQRPDVRAAEERIVAEVARVGQANRRQYPQFSLTGSIGVEILSGALTGGTSLLGSVTGSVLQTVFDRGRIRQQIELQSAVQEQAVASYDATVLLALEEVENALVAFEKNRLRLASLSAAQEAANNAALLAQTQYQAGLTDFQTVLDTQRTVLSVEDSVATTRGDRITALIQLYKALGGGWNASEQVIAGATGTTQS
jgi:outer membrane protein, multidrug efflux system